MWSCSKSYVASHHCSTASLQFIIINLLQIHKNQLLKEKKAPVVFDVRAAPDRLLVHSNPSYRDKECDKEKSSQWVKFWGMYLVICLYIEKSGLNFISTWTLGKQQIVWLITQWPGKSKIQKLEAKRPGKEVWRGHLIVNLKYINFCVSRQSL